MGSGNSTETADCHWMLKQPDCRLTVRNCVIIYQNFNRPLYTFCFIAYYMTFIAYGPLLCFVLHSVLTCVRSMRQERANERYRNTVKDLFLRFGGKCGVRSVENAECVRFSR